MAVTMAMNKNEVFSFGSMNKLNKLSSGDRNFFLVAKSKTLERNEFKTI